MSCCDYVTKRQGPNGRFLSWCRKQPRGESHMARNYQHFLEAASGLQEIASRKPGSYNHSDGLYQYPK